MSAQDTILNGRYRLLSQQGSGGMAVVYKAQDLRLGRVVAVKILRPSLTSDPSFLQRFQQEARNVANLAHPNIVTLHDFGQDGNTYYMVMEFIDGQDLKKIIRGAAPFTVERALHIGIQLCAGIGYAHRAGLIHADVKPQNILITGSDVVKVTDFGIAQALSVAQQMERQNIVWGSPHYFAPEQATGEPPNTASDVYAIGIVMFEMFTGKLPYSGADQQELAMAHIREQVPHVMEQNPNVPVHLDRIIHKVMSKEPAQRYRTADQLGRILISYQKQGQDYTQNQGPTPTPGGPPAQPPAGASASAAPVAAPQPIPLRPTGNTPNTPSQPSKPGTAYTPPPQPAPLQPTPSGLFTSAPSGQSGPAKTSPAQSYPAGQYTAPGAGANQFGTPSGQTMPSGQGGGGYATPYAQPSNNQGAAQQQPMYAQPGTGGQRPVSPSSVPNAYAPGTDYLSQSGPNRPIAPSYKMASRPASVDVVSIILGLIAFGAIVGLVLLWLAVLNAFR
jgi:serine/threonine-protein kinase